MIKSCQENFNNALEFSKHDSKIITPVSLRRDIRRRPVDETKRAISSVNNPNKVKIAFRYKRQSISLSLDISLYCMLDFIAERQDRSLCSLMFSIKKLNRELIPLADAALRYALMYFYMRAHYPMSDFSYPLLGLPPLKMRDRNFQLNSSLFKAYCVELNLDHYEIAEIYENNSRNV